jgi:hypothetical protein
VNIVYVRHIRCDEWRDGEFYIAPEDLTKEKFEADVDTAQKAYLDAQRQFELLTPKPDPWITWINQYEDERNGIKDDMTVKEVRALKQQRIAEAKAYDEAESKAAGAFHGHLAALGYRRLLDLRTGEDHPEVLVAEAEWGHRHGQKIDF